MNTDDGSTSAAGGAGGAGGSGSSVDAAARLLDLWHRWENPGRSANRGLNLRKIAEAGVELADADGLAAVSMARVADKLGYSPMALYRHVAGKDELLQLMLQAVTEASGFPDIPPDIGWRAGIEQWARAVLRPYLSSPWLVDVNPTGLNTPGQLAAMDLGLRVLAGTGLSYAERAGVLLELSAHVIGHVRLIANLRRTDSGEGAPLGTLMAHLAGTGRHPTVDAALAAGIFGDGDGELDDFEFGLALILDGVEALIARGPADG